MPLLSDYPEASTEQNLLIPVQVKGEKEWRHIPASALSAESQNYWYESSLETPITLNFIVNE